MVLIIFTVSIIKLPSRKSTRYGFNVPNSYLKIKPKHAYDKHTMAEKGSYVCAYQGVRNVSFLKHFAYVLNG